MDIFDIMCPNKRGGRKNFQNLINGEVLIRPGRVENFWKINKRASPFIRQVRVLLLKFDFERTFLIYSSEHINFLKIKKNYSGYSI